MAFFCVHVPGTPHPLRAEYRMQNTEVAWTLGIFAGRMEHELHVCLDSRHIGLLGGETISLLKLYEYNLLLWLS